MVSKARGQAPGRKELTMTTTQLPQQEGTGMVTGRVALVTGGTAASAPRSAAAWTFW
jgi:hypothetical protein